MKKIFLFALLSLLTLQLCAQPAKRRNQNTPASTASASETQKAKTGVSYRDFPTAQPMPTDVSWRRDVYRTLDLSRDENATLYYPTMPQGGRQNLFSYLFYLLRKKMIKAYDTNLEANENFAESNTVSARALMDRYKMYYERDSVKKTIRINDADIPSDEVKLYYIKESVYYDQNTATFHSRVTALCPVLVRGDEEFGGTEARYPMFWVKYDDVAPYLGKLPLMSSNLNNAATISADDYFTLGRYKGDIYRTVNLQDRLLASYCPEDSDLVREQQRIESELTSFQRHVWGEDSVATKATADATAADTLQDSDATAEGDKAVNTSSSRRRSTLSSRSRRSSSTNKSSAKATTNRQKQKSTRQRTPRQKSSSSSGGLSVRRQRH